jgi:predicted Ser/Thr protein kinase
MRLVAQYTSAPVPKVIFSNYKPGEGSMEMSFIPGQPLDCLWDRLDEHTKERVCHKTWVMIFQWRQIQRPP